MCWTSQKELKSLSTRGSGDEVRKFREKKLLHNLFTISGTASFVTDKNGLFKVVTRMADLEELIPEIHIGNL